MRHDGSAFSFEVDPFRKHCLLNGLDDIGLTMEKMEAIRAFEARRSIETPWLDGATTRVPKLFAVKDMPKITPPATPTTEDWREEARQAMRAHARGRRGRWRRRFRGRAAIRNRSGRLLQ